MIVEKIVSVHKYNTTNFCSVKIFFWYSGNVGFLTFSRKSQKLGIVTFNYIFSDKILYHEYTPHLS